MNKKQLKDIQDHINVTDYLLMKRTEIDGFSSNLWINSGNIKKLYDITLPRLRKILNNMKTQKITFISMIENKPHKTTTIKNYTEEPWSYSSLIKGETISITIINSSTEKLLQYKKILLNKLTQ